METSEDLVGRLRREMSLEASDISSLAFDQLDIDEPRFVTCQSRNGRYVGGDLERSSWIDCKLAACEFVSVKLNNAVFTGCRFADLEESVGSRFRFCELNGARFENCDLSLALFYGCDCFQTEFIKCRLRGAIFDTVKFSRSFGRKIIRYGATFDDSDLEYATLQNINLSSCTVKACNLTRANLTNSNFSNAHLQGSDLTDAILDGANLSGADLCFARLEGMDLRILSSYQGMRISANQQHHLLRSLNIDVTPD